MKYSFFFLIAGMLQTFAAASYSQTAKLTLDMQDVTVAQAISEIENVSQFYFTYNTREINPNRIISIHVQEDDIHTVMKNLFADENVNYIVADKHVVLYKDSERFYLGNVTQDIVITGFVTDEAGEPLPGVSVMIKGTTQGTATDINGAYSLSVKNENATLVYSYIGFATKEMLVGNQRNINITMHEDTREIEEVVVVGYGSMSKRVVTTAIASLKGDALDKMPVTNVTQAMIGQVSGIRLQQISAEPGTSPSIRIRGIGSISSGNNPLFVIDGYPTSDINLFNSISPADIESIDILKDAAASAIYGSRAGNGVIMVTTKRGKEGTPTFFANATYGIQKIQKKIALLNGPEYVEVAKEALIYNGQPIPAIFNDPSRWVETDWQDIIFQAAPYQNYQIGANGGTDKIKYAISGGYVDQEGILINTYMKRFNLKVNMDAKLGKLINLGVSMLPSYTFSRKEYPQGPNNQGDAFGGVIAEALSMPPIVPVFLPNGDYYVPIQDKENPGVFNDQIINPLNKLNALKETYGTYQQAANMYLSMTPLKGLTLKSTINTGIYVDTKDMYVEAFFCRGAGNTGNISTPNLSVINAERAVTRNINWYWSNTANYDFSIQEKHQFTALLGYDVAQYFFFRTNVTPRTDSDTPVAFDNTTIKNIQGAILKNGDSSSSEYVFDAVFGRINYNFAQKYIFSASLRRDRSSRFGTQNRAGVFPSVSGAWVISDESFMNQLGALSTLKVRASYGITGNDQLSGQYPWIITMGKNYYNFGTNDARVFGYNPGGFSNEELGWEKNKQFDFGIDLGLFKNRIGLLFDLYKRNSNTILSASIPSLNGKAGSVIMNVGNVENKGMEITINTKNFVHDFKWTTDFNISFNKNKIVALAPGQIMLTNQTAGTFWGDVCRNYVGRPIGDLYMYIVDGTFNNENDVATLPKMGTQEIGDLRFRDVSGPDGVPDGRITADDMAYVGNYQPKFFYGMTNSFSYKNFDLTLLVDGVYGNKIIYALERPISLARNIENSSKGVLNRWKSESDPGNGRYHRAGTKNLGNNVGGNTRYLYDGRFFRIRQVYLSYTIPQTYIKRSGLSSCRVFISGDNLFTFAEFPGYNPEGNYSGDTATRNGVEQGTYPVARVISFGLNLSF